MPEYVESVRLSSAPKADSYVAALPVVRNLQRMGTLHFTSNVVFLVGENGTGKSTLLEAIAVALGFNPEGGTRNFNFATRETHSPLYESLTVSRTAHRPRDGFFLRAESFYNVASDIDALDDGVGDLLASYGGVSLHARSHGESFLALVQNRFGGEGLYLLDEPEAALSPSRQMTLMVQIHTLLARRSQFIIATHSPLLMAYPGAQVIELTDDALCTVRYTETEHYLVTKRFLDAPEQMLRFLLDDTPEENET